MRYCHEKACMEMSVRELCALVHAGGSIDMRLPPRHMRQRAMEGVELHKQVRDLHGEGYYAEVPLQHKCRLEGMDLLVSGRADGVWVTPDGGYVVEEIKSVTVPPAWMSRTPREQDLAQLSCYAYFLCAAKGLSSVTLRLTYVYAQGSGARQETFTEEDMVHVDSMLAMESLQALYMAMLRVVWPQVKDRMTRETEIRALAKQALFPYPHMRPAQKDMILECWRDMRHKQTLFAQAPTGIGKTIATLYPAVRCWGEGRCDKIFYLTAKTSTRREAFGAVRKLVETGTPVRACVITARESMCLCEAARASVRTREGDAWGRGRLTDYCNPDRCPYAKDYYARVEAVIRKLLETGNGLLSGQSIRKAAEEGRVCPYELSLDVSERCEIVICDYNYVFSPQVRLQRYFAEGIPHTEGHRYLFLVDEAHNLPDRARDMYSGTLQLSDLQALQAQMAAYEAEEAKAIFPAEDGAQRGRVTLCASMLDDVIGILTRRADVCAGEAITDNDGVRHGVALEEAAPLGLQEAVEELSKKCDGWLRYNAMHPLCRIVDGLASLLRAFHTAGLYYDQHFATFTEMEGNEVRVRLLCLDPSGIVGPLLQMAESCVLFSATLTPTDYFADILGGGKGAVMVSFSSPFPPEHLCVAVADHISVRYEDRNKADTVRRVVSYIAAMASVKPGNYLIYCPSYAYLDKVYALFHKKYPKVRTVVQRPDMSVTDREAFLAAFQPDSDALQIGFCVLGGAFSEGVDLPGKSLIGVVIVGVGLPGLSNERNIVKTYYDSLREGEGYAYAYVYPGMNHVLQAAGRVIRRDDDKGVVVLLDDRYLAPPYLGLYPSHWENMHAIGDPASLAGLLRGFWKQNP